MLVEILSGMRRLWVSGEFGSDPSGAQDLIGK
jgi:hypothetical protein